VNLEHQANGSASKLNPWKIALTEAPARRDFTFLSSRGTKISSVAIVLYLEFQYLS
jgi:hypothetical protein